MDNDEIPLRPSKSQRKRDMTALQKIGEILVKLPPSELAKVPLDDQLAEAITMAQSITNHEGKRRQLQYIGRLMRKIDPTPIQDALDKLQGKHQQAQAQFHHLEHWRTKLITEGDNALQECLQQFPHADHQHLRQLIRKAQKEQKEGKNQGASTELFRYLRDLKDHDM